MNAAQINNEIEALRQLIFNEIHHRILVKNTGQPLIKEEQLFFILLPFFQGQVYDDAMKASVASVGIVHASLEEHEKVREVSAEDKEQQLRVLSGDFYSGRYYEILANSGNIKLIQHLSLGIVARCEQQIKLYESKFLTLDEWIQFITVVESELIIKFYESIGVENYAKLAKQVLTVTFLKELIQKMENKTQSILINRLFESSMNILMLQQQMEEIKQQIPLTINELTLDDSIIGWINEICLT